MWRQIFFNGRKNGSLLILSLPRNNNRVDARGVQTRERLTVMKVSEYQEENEKEYQYEDKYGDAAARHGIW